MLSLADFKKLVADDIRGLSEKEIEILFVVTNNFSNIAYKIWSTKSKESAKKMLQ